jgi:hypothetical protein
MDERLLLLTSIRRDLETRMEELDHKEEEERIGWKT